MTWIDMNYDCVRTGLSHVLILTVIIFYFLDDDSFALLHWLTFIQLLLSFSQKFLKQKHIRASLIYPRWTKRYLHIRGKVTYSSCRIMGLFLQHHPQVLCSHLKFVHVVINSGTTEES